MTKVQQFKTKSLDRLDCYKQFIKEFEKMTKTLTLCKKWIWFIESLNNVRKYFAITIVALGAVKAPQDQQDQSHIPNFMCELSILVSKKLID